MTSKKLATVFNEYHWGAFIASKFQMLFTIIIMIGVFKLPVWLIVAMIPVFIVTLWGIGKLFIASGMRDVFIGYEQTAVINKITESKNEKG